MHFYQRNSGFYLDEPLILYENELEVNIKEII